MIEIVKYTFLLCVAIIAALIVLCFILFLFSKYPIRTNLAVVIFLLILGVPILYIPVIYFTTIALVCIIIGLIFWISSMGESKKAVKYSESSSKKEMMTDVINNAAIETNISVHSSASEDPNHIFHNINGSSHSEVTTSSFLSLLFNSNHSQNQEKIDYKTFKEYNSLLACNYNYDDDDLPLEQEHISTSSISKNIEVRRLVSLEIKPDFVCLNPNQEQVFTVFGIDQFGAELPPGEVVWKATGGEINSQGQLIINNDAKGTFRVTATEIFTNTQVSQYSLSRKLLLIKISFKIFSWALSYKKLIKDVASYFIQEFSDSELLANEIFPDIDTNNINGIAIILAFEEIKEWMIATIIDILIDYLEKFVVICFMEKSSLLNSSVSYVVLPKLRNLIISPSNIDIKPGESSVFKLIGIDQKGEKIEIERKISWKATGGSIDSKGKLTVNQNSQGSFEVTATITNLSASINYRVISESSNEISSFNEKNKSYEHHRMERILNKQRIRFEGMKNTFVHTDREKTERAELNSYFSCLDGSCSELCYEGYYFHENYQDYICYSRNHEFRYDKHLEYIDSKDWFCNSQLFYDGYSLEDGLSYEEYLEYIDSKDYYSYSNIN